MSRVHKLCSFLSACALALAVPSGMATPDNAPGQPADIAASAYLYRADRAVGQNPPEAWILLMQRGDMPFTQPLDLQAPVVKKALCGLLWEDVRRVDHLELCWTPGTARKPSPEELEVTCLDGADEAAHTWWNPRAIREAAQPEVSADGSVYSYKIPVDTWGVIVSVRGTSVAAGFAVPELHAYLTKGNVRLHLVGILGGMIWNVGCRLAFSPAARPAPHSLMGRSNPAQAGGKLPIGQDADGKPIYNWLVRLADHGRIPKLPKFGVDPAGIPTIVSDGLFRFMNCLTNGSYFDGLHVFRDISFSFFPDPASILEVSHTVNCHHHAYGNSSRRFTPKDAARIWFACHRLLLKAGNDCAYVYPDIVLRPTPTVEALESAINYVIKPFKFADCYIRGLERGCLVSGLNHTFHQTAFESESLLHGPPQGYAFGNMAQKSRGHYIGVPPTKRMSRAQVKRFRERLNADEAHAWEMERYQKHLELLQKKKTRSQQQL